MRKLVMYVWLIILFSSAAVYAAEVTVSVDNSSATYSSSGANGVSLSGWEIWVRSTTFTPISGGNINKNDTDDSGSASFNLAEGDYFVGAVYFDKTGDLWAPLYVGVSANAAGNDLNILEVPANETAKINNFSEAGAVRGYVTDANGIGINDAYITVVDSDITLPITTRTFDGRDGYYSIFLSPGTYTLKIEEPESESVTEYSVTVTQGYGSTGSEFTNITLVPFTANEPQEIDFEEELGIPLNITITTNSSLTAGIVPTVTDDASDLGASDAAYSLGSGSRLIGSYLRIEVSDNINSTSQTLTNVNLTLNYGGYDLQGASEDSLTLYWYNSSGDEWKSLDVGADYGPDGPKVLDAGRNPSEKIVWVTLNHFSIFSLIGTVSAQPASDTGGGGSCNHQLKISDITPPADAAPGSDVQFQVVIDNVGTCAETGVKTTITDLPGGWTGGDVTTDVGYGKTVSVNVPVSIPGDAATGTVTLTFKVDPQDFIGTLEKQISFNVGEVPPEEVVTPAPIAETVAPPEVETPTPAPPVETQGPEQEPVKAPEGEGKEKGGICGPTAILLISVLSLLAIRRRR